jgi:hypothetical protein
LATSKIFPQGSVRIGTTNKPVQRQEYDIDLVCQLQLDPAVFPDPSVLLDAVEARMSEHERYRAMIEPKPRCVRVTYATEFHLDVIPACPDRFLGGTCLVIPERDAKHWRASNPKGFAGWFLRRCELRQLEFAEKAEPIPALEPADRKAPLKLAVQLLKRARDIAFLTDRKLAPSSIVLTTLAAMHYQGERTVSGAISRILRRTVNSLPVTGRLFVLNPANPQENFGDCWSDEHLYACFVQFISSLNHAWEQLLTTRGLPNLGIQLQRLFGDELAKSVMKEQMQFVTDLRDKGELGIHRGSAVLSGLTTGAMSVPRNTFYGGDE